MQVWVETQSTNPPAVKFYMRAGLTFCGLDTSLYDPSQAPGDVALFFGAELDQLPGPGDAR